MSLLYKPMFAAYVAPPAPGQLLYTLSNPNAYGTSKGDEFGRAVAISGSYLIVGAHEEDKDGLYHSGVAYIFDAPTGQLLHTLTNPNETNAEFGCSVSISGHYAAVGAYRDGTGKAYIYDVVTGQLVHELATTSTTQGFGHAISISDQYVIVGDTYNQAHVFDVTTGQLLYTLEDPNTYRWPTGDYFGYTVSTYGQYAIVGADSEDDAEFGSTGVAYIFDVTSGQLLHTLHNPVPGDLSYFGRSVSISGQLASVCSTDGVYVYDVVSGQLLHSQSIAGSTHVSAISEQHVIIGTFLSNKARIYDTATGQLLNSLSNPNVYPGESPDAFGYSVAISMQYAIVGAHYEDDSEADYNSGKVYVYSV